MVRGNRLVPSVMLVTPEGNSFVASVYVCAILLKGSTSMSCYCLMWCLQCERLGFSSQKLDGDSASQSHLGTAAALLQCWILTPF